MSSARGILAAGFVAIVTTSAHALYRWWPVTQGAEVVVSAALYGRPADVAMVGVDLPLARLELDVPHTAPAVTESFEPVQRIGEWWTIEGDKGVNQKKRYGRPLYLQLTAGQPLWPGGPVEMRPATVSDTVVAGAINLAGTVARVRDDGYVWLEFPFGLIGVPRDVAAHARPPLAPGPRASATAQIQPASDPGVFAVLRVLPSGRAALVAVVVNGKRY